MDNLKEINPIKAEIIKSASLVHHDLGNILNEISYVAKERTQPENVRVETIDRMLQDYKEKLEYLNYLIELTQ